MAERLNRFLGPLQAHWKGLLLLLLGVALPAFGLALLAEDVWTHEGFGWDRPIQAWAHSLSSPAHDQLVAWVTQLGYAWGVLPVSIAFLLYLVVRGRFRIAAFFFTAEAGAVLFEYSGKLLFHRVRPALWTSPAPASGYSFPSGHATFSSAFVVALVVLTWHTAARWPVLVLGIAFVALIGFSRVYLGVHYPSDIAAGWMLSLAWVMGVRAVIRPGSLGGVDGHGAADRARPRRRTDERVS